MPCNPATARRLRSARSGSRRRALIGLLGLGLTACGAWPSPVWVPVDRAAHPAADAVILADDGRLRFTADPMPGFVFQRRIRLAVLTPRGRAQAEVAIPLDGWTTLEEFHGRSFGPEGEDAAEVGGETIYTVPARPDAGVLFSDVRVARTLIPAVDVGDIVEYRYTVRSTQRFALPSWTFESGLPVVRSRLLISKAVPAPVRWSFARRGRVEAIEPALFEDHDGQWLAFERRDLPGFRPEPYGPPPAQQIERLRVMIASSPSGASWASLGAWYRGLMSAGLDLPPSAAEMARTATEGRSPAERAAWADDFVRTRIRYVATHIGIGAFQPHPVAAVLGDGYGDCKDMVTALVALGQALDLEIQPVLIGTTGHGVHDPSLPAVSSFDHVIAAIRLGDGWVFTDPTDRGGAMGQLGRQVAGQPGLRIGPDSAELITVPPLAPGGDRAVLDWRFEDDERLRLEARFGGRAARPWREAPEDARDRAALVRHVFFGAEPAVELSAVRIEAAEGGITVSAEARWPGLWTALDDGIEGLALHGFMGRTAEIRLPAARESAVYLGPPRVREVRLDLPWPAAWRGITPRSSVEESPLGGSRWVAEVVDGRLRLSHRLAIDVPRVGADGLPALRALMEHAATVGRSLLVRHRGPM